MITAKLSAVISENPGLPAQSLQRRFRCSKRRGTLARRQQAAVHESKKMNETGVTYGRAEIHLQRKLKSLRNKRTDFEIRVAGFGKDGAALPEIENRAGQAANGG